MRVVTLRDFIDISIKDSIAERVASVGWTGVTDAEREIGCLYIWHWHMLHGGLWAVFTELETTLLRAAHSALDRIGARRAYELFGDAIATVPRALLGMKALDRCKGFQTFFDRSVMAEFDTALANSEIGDLKLPLVDDYVATHPDLFPGPRSLVELWASMCARGENIKPQRLLEMERYAELDAESTERRCSVCGQPVPTYKLRCRRCGRPCMNE